MNSIVSSKQTEAKQLARQGIEQILPPKPTRRPLPCLLGWTLDNVHRGPAPRGVEEGVPGTVQQLLQAVPHHCEGHQCGGGDKFIFISHFFPNMLPNISYFITFTVIYFLRAYIQVIFYVE